MGTLLYFIVFAGLFFLMMRVGCGAHVMGHGHRHNERHGADPLQDRYSARSVPPDTALEPVCGMSVGISWAKSALYQGRVYYFCTAEHREAFEVEPDRYIGATTGPEAKSMEHPHA
jgi:YHS domain-containing protein